MRPEGTIFDEGFFEFGTDAADRIKVFSPDVNDKLFFGLTSFGFVPVQIEVSPHLKPAQMQTAQTLVRPNIPPQGHLYHLDAFTIPCI